MLRSGSDPSTPRPTVGSSPVRDLLALTRRPEVISFAGGLPATELIDLDGLRAAFAAVLAGPAAASSLQYSTTEGDPRLRAALAALMTGRGTATDPDEVLVTTGSQQGLGLVAATLLAPGDPVLVEEPTYLAALQVLRLWGARPIGVPCDADGLDVDALDALATHHGARVLYTIPTFQNPTGRSLSGGRREALAEVAQRHGLWVVEDDPYSELRYRGTAGPPLASLPGLRERTIALSTLSKICAPGLRIGWLRCPPSLHGALVVAKQAADLHSSTIDQAVAAHWLATVDLPEHLRRLRDVYAQRHSALLNGLTAALPSGSEHSTPTAGCSCGTGCRRAGTPKPACPRRWRATSPTSRGRPSSPGIPTPARYGCHSPANPRNASSPGWSASPPRWRPPGRTAAALSAAASGGPDPAWQRMWWDIVTWRWSTSG